MSSRNRQRTLTTIIAAIEAHHDPALAVAVADLHYCANHFLEAAQRLQDARPSSLGSAGSDGPAVSGSGISNPTARLALAQDPTAIDRAMMDLALRTLVRHARNAPAHPRQIGSAAHTLRRIVTAWTPRHPTDKDKRNVEHLNDRDLCAHHRTAGLVEYVVHTGTVSGNLPQPLGLCSACYWQVRRTGSLPSAEWLEQRARTGKASKIYVG